MLLSHQFMMLLNLQQSHLEDFWTCSQSFTITILFWSHDIKYYFTLTFFYRSLPCSSFPHRAGPRAGRPSRCSPGKPRCPAHHEPRYESLRSDQTGLGYHGCCSVGCLAVGSASGSADGCSDPRPPGCTPRPGGAPGYSRFKEVVNIFLANSAKSLQCKPKLK